MILGSCWIEVQLNKLIIGIDILGMKLAAVVMAGFQRGHRIVKVRYTSCIPLLVFAVVVHTIFIRRRGNNGESFIR